MSGPGRTVPGWKTPQVERREAACPQGTRHRKVQTKKVRLSALRSLTHVREKEREGGPRRAFTRVFAALWPAK